MCERPLGHIVAPSERSVLVGGYLRSLLGFDGIPFEVANRFTNKLAMKNALSAAGLPHVQYAPLRHLSAMGEVAQKLGWPVMVKPVFGAGGIDSLVVESAAGFARLMASETSRRYQDYPAILLAERYTEIEAEYHCDGLVGVVPAIKMQFGVDLWQAFIDVSLSRKVEVSPCRTPGIVVQVMLPAKPGVIRKVSAAAELARLPGVVHVDMILGVGDQVPASLHSSYVSGLVYARVPDEDAVERLRLAVERAYTIKTDPLGGAPGRPPRPR
jgi:biotin carboxylase